MSMKGEIVLRICLVYVLMIIIASAEVFQALRVQLWEG